MAVATAALEAVQRRFGVVAPLLDERRRRLVAAAEALALGWGGVAGVARVTGVARGAIQAGLGELRAPAAERLSTDRMRRPGGGRTRRVATAPTRREDHERLVEPVTRGDPAAPLRWTSQSVRTLAGEVPAQGHAVSDQLVAERLHDLGYRLQATRKTRDGGDHPARDAQFGYLNEQVAAPWAAGEPAISVDTKPKEVVGHFTNGGRQWHPDGPPAVVRVHDVVDRDLGRASPYGIYDRAHPTGWVNVGIDHDTAACAVGSIRRWWHGMGQTVYPDAPRLLICADGGGRNGARVRLWKREGQRLADATGRTIVVRQLPPGTSKWTTIEHRLVSFISQNWRGTPLVSHAVIVSLIAATTTATGRRVHAQLDQTTSPTGRKVSTGELATVRLQRHAVHGEWNYTTLPTTVAPSA